MVNSGLPHIDTGEVWPMVNSGLPPIDMVELCDLRYFRCLAQLLDPATGLIWVKFPGQIV